MHLEYKDKSKRKGIIDIREVEVYKKLVNRLEWLGWSYYDNLGAKESSCLVIRGEEYGPFILNIELKYDESIKYSIWLGVKTQSFMFEGDRSDVNDILAKILVILMYGTGNTTKLSLVGIEHPCLEAEIHGYYS